MYVIYIPGVTVQMWKIHSQIPCQVAEFDTFGGAWRGLDAPSDGLGRGGGRLVVDPKNKSKKLVETGGVHVNVI